MILACYNCIAKDCYSCRCPHWIHHTSQPGAETVPFSLGLALCSAGPGMEARRGFVLSSRVRRDRAGTWHWFLCFLLQCFQFDQQSLQLGEESSSGVILGSRWALSLCLMSSWQDKELTSVPACTLAAPLCTSVPEAGVCPLGQECCSGRCQPEHPGHGLVVRLGHAWKTRGRHSGCVTRPRGAGEAAAPLLVVKQHGASSPARSRGEHTRGGGTGGEPWANAFV